MKFRIWDDRGKDDEEAEVFLKLLTDDDDGSVSIAVVDKFGEKITLLLEISPIGKYNLNLSVKWGLGFLLDERRRLVRGEDICPSNDLKV